MITYSSSARLQPEEYLEFLTRTDLGQQYPQEDFIERITTLVSRTSITITARNEAGMLVGAAMGVTDFAYYLLVTDLGVDRKYTGQGIGRELLTRIHEAAGGTQRICVFLDTYTPAQGFYKKCGYEMADSVMYSLDESAWTFFDLTPEKLEEMRPLLLPHPRSLPRPH
jgi:GNAT superfamily N-acetyltransferase